MLCRFTNLLTLAALFAVILVTAKELHGNWNSALPWEQEWIKIPTREPKHTSDQFLLAIRNATEAGEFDDVDKLKRALKEDYRPTGRVIVHINQSELLAAVEISAKSLLLFLIPLAINYLRHGVFRIWNREPY